MFEIINTYEAPKAIGTYSQATKVGNTVYLSGQIALDPISGDLVNSDLKSEIQQVFKNLSAVVKAAGGHLNQIVKLTVYITDFDYFPMVNEVMMEVFSAPFPARATVGVKALPRNARVEVDGILQL